MTTKKCKNCGMPLKSKEDCCPCEESTCCCCCCCPTDCVCGCRQKNKHKPS
ncbi:MAG: hypothetical protein HWN80_19625 [Candidatus Lokiarchaeota archaeon]|nr:hypothetical protein [Candidatus Lokiarchaeota archaeon]